MDVPAPSDMEFALLCLLVVAPSEDWVVPAHAAEDALLVLLFLKKNLFIYF